MILGKIQPVIMAGGSGVRLWPVSTVDTPKQLISLGDKGTLLEETVKRILMITEKCEEMNYSIYPPLFVMHESHKLPDILSIYEDNVIYEGYANDTAVAIAKAAIEINNRYGDEKIIILAMPADHYIYNVDVFVKDIVDGISHVTYNNIVLYGITPSAPETKYGYIIPGDNITFKEKPTVDVAIELLNKNALWNSGIFAANTDVILDCIYKSPYNIINWINIPRAGKAPSFDVAVLQEYSNIYAHHCTGWRWSDIGTWDSFIDTPEIKHEMEKQKGVVMVNCSDINVLKRPKNSPGKIVIIGCSDLFIVSNSDNILIMSNNSMKHTDYNSILKELLTVN